MQECEERSSHYQTRYKELCQTWDVTNKEASEAVAANRRLHILTKSLQSQIFKANASIDNLQQGLAEKLEEIQRFEKDMAELRKQLTEQKLEKRKAEFELDKNIKEQLRKYNLMEDKYQLKYAGDISQMSKRIQELEKALKMENDEHKRTKIGLDHLRLHFSSLPYAESAKAKTIVTENELTKLSYS